MPDTFSLAEVNRGLQGTRFHGHLHHLAITGSTNQLALEAAQAGAQTGVWIADEQTAGRGRGGHSWHSAPGDGLYVSALVRLDIPLRDAKDLPFATALAMQAAVVDATGLTLDLRWPNDLMFGDRKCGGILIESSSEPAGRRQGSWFAVIGVGLNVNTQAFPPELAALATSLRLESDRSFDRETILVAFLRHLDLELDRLRQATGQPSDLQARFCAASSWVEGKRVRVGEGDEAYSGITRGLDADGFLRVEDTSGRMRLVLSGGVRSAKD